MTQRMLLTSLPLLHLKSMQVRAVGTYLSAGFEKGLEKSQASQLFYLCLFLGLTQQCSGVIIDYVLRNHLNHCSKDYIYSAIYYQTRVCYMQGKCLNYFCTISLAPFSSYSVGCFSKQCSKALERAFLVIPGQKTKQFSAQPGNMGCWGSEMLWATEVTASSAGRPQGYFGQYWRPSRAILCGTGDAIWCHSSNLGSVTCQTCAPDICTISQALESLCVFLFFFFF